MAFIQELLSNSPVYSFGRFMALVMTVFVLGWITGNFVFCWRWNMLHATQTPMSLFPDPLLLGALGTFALLFYGTTKIGDAVIKTPTGGQ